MNTQNSSKLWVLMALVVGWCSVSTTSALAQDPPEISVRNFKASASPFGLFMVEGARSLKHLQISGGLMLDFAAEPLRVLDEQDNIALVDNQMMGDLLFSLGLFDRFELGVALPVVLVNTVEINNVDLSGTVLGDMSIRPRVAILDPRKDVLGLAIYTHLTLPTGDKSAFVSEDALTLRNGVVLERHLGQSFSLMLNLGFQFREPKKFESLVVGNEGTYGAGLQYDIIEDFLIVGGELNGSTSLGDPFDIVTSPLEALGGVKLRPLAGLQIEVGGGRGLVGGYGAPDFRVFAGVRYAPFLEVPEAIVEQVEDMMIGINYIPTEREWLRIGPKAAEALRKIVLEDGPVVGQSRALSSLRHFPNDDTKIFLIGMLRDNKAPLRLRRKAMLTLAVAFGARPFPNGVCVQLPQDKAVLNALKPFLLSEDDYLRESAVEAIAFIRTPEAFAALAERAPEEPLARIKERMTGLTTSGFAPNGCPDADSDGVSDQADRCPDQAEDRDGIEDEDGCPEGPLDYDKDGIADTEDKCPEEAGIASLGGCPDRDNDGDGIKEGDKCPDAAEDKDGFEDEDGCPDLDNDKDGIPDDKDKCPNEAEVLNGVKDDDGCPDKGKSIVTKDLDILEKVFFAGGKAAIKRRSFPLLKAVALVLKGHPEILVVEVQGHTDDQGKPAANLKLSETRANAVRKYLIDQGVAPERLKAKGYGQTAPAVPIEGLTGAKLKKARDVNRRVQFDILKRTPTNKE